MRDERWQVTVRVPMRLPDGQREALFSRIADVVSDWEPEQRDGWDADVAAAPAGDEPMLPAVFGYEVGQRDAQGDVALLQWLHAEASWWLALDRDEHESADQLHGWYRQAEYARQQMAIARAERDRERSSRQAWADKAAEFERRLTESQLDLLDRGREIARLRREVEFEALGGVGLIGLADVASVRDNLRYPLCACVPDAEAAALVEAGFTRPQCTVHPDGGAA